MAMYYSQPGFVSGEMAPSLYGRTDLAKYKQGTSVLRNSFVNYRGGTLSRPGSSYVGMCKQAAPNAGGTATNFPPRDIKFQFNINQGFDLEFGDQYMRVVSNGAYVTETAQAISSVSNANPGVVTIPSHGYNNGDWVYAYGATIWYDAFGVSQALNGLTWIVQNATTDTFTLTDLFGNIFNGIDFFLNGDGTFARIYTVASPYAAVDLPYLKFTQSSNTMSLTCWNQMTQTEYPPYELLRVADNNWTFSQETFSVAIAAPTGTASSATSSTTVDTWYSYVVTAVDQLGNESVASVKTDVYNNDISVNAGSNTVTWDTVTGAQNYNVYAAQPIYVGATAADPGFIGAQYGYIGSAFGASFTDSNITADFTTTPPLHSNPFAPGAVLYLTPTAGGSGYTQDNIGYTLNTSTGIGADITLIVQGGAFVGGIVNESGYNFASTDTITITSASGAPPTQATGSITFYGMPDNGSNNLQINGVLFGLGGVYYFPIDQGTISGFVSQFALNLNGLTDAGIDVATYVANGQTLNITYKTTGTSGNSFSLVNGSGSAASPVTLSGSTLSGGTGGSGGGTGATAVLTIGPETGVYPGLVAYFQQRRVYASTINNPDTYYMSQPGSYANFDASIPTVDSDAIIGTPWAQQVNGIQALLVCPTGLLAFCGNGAWLINGGAASAITPADQDAQSQAYNGISPFVPPIPINYHILYIQAKGSIMRDLAFNIFVSVYTGEDITIISNHLFSGFTIPQMAYAEEPFKLVWGVRNDGVLLSLTYLAEQDIKAWARHDTNGLYVGVITVTEPPVDAVYLIVQRYVQGHWVYYKERFDNRSWTLAEDCFCVDAGLTYPMTYPDATLYPAAATGTNNITSTLYIASGSDYTAPTAQAVDPTGLGSGATFTVEVSSQTVQAVSQSTACALTPDGTKLFVLGNSGFVIVISTETLQELQIIQVGSSPSYIAITPDGTKAYVPNSGDNTVTCINISNYSTTTISSGTLNYPVGIAITPDGTKAYITNFGANTVSVLTTATNTISGTTIPVTSGSQIVITPDGTKAYAGSEGTAVSCIVLSGDTVSTISVGNFPAALAVTPDGTHVYVANSESNTVSVIATSSNTVVNTFNVGTFPDAVLATNSTVYIANGNDDTVTVYDIASAQSTLINNSTFDAPSALALLGDTLYVVNSNNETVTINIPGQYGIGAVIPIENGQNYSNQTQIVITDSTGSGAIFNPVITNNVSFTASASVFDGETVGVVGQVIRVGNGQAVVTSYTSGTELVANITQPITATVPNDPNLTPIPAISGNWSIATPTTTVGGLNHLQGLTVTGLADGGVITPTVVGLIPNTGEIGITLPVSATAINVGLPFIVQGQTMQLDFPDQAGSSQGRRKNIAGVNIRFEQSRGISVGTNQVIAATLPGMVNPIWTDMIEVKESNPEIPLGQSIPLITGDHFLPVFNDWNIDGRVAWQQTNPLPCNMLAVFPKFVTGDSGG